MNRNFILEQSRRDNTREAQITPHKRSVVWGLLTLILILATLSLSAQSYSPCYTNNMAKGDAAYKQGKYSDAKTYYANAKQCAGGNPTAAQQKINSCDAKIKAQKDAAEAKRRAEEERIAEEKRQEEMAEQERIAEEKRQEEARKKAVEEAEIQRLKSACPTTMRDYDGNVYNTVFLGKQCWMKENLRTTHYSNGESIKMGTADLSSMSPLGYYSLDVLYDQNMSSYGYLYNWAAAMHGSFSSDSKPSGVQGICPNGWHLPSMAEWSQLREYVSSQLEYQCGGDVKHIGKALSSTSGWRKSSSDCAIGNDLSSNNSTGFSALPANRYDGFTTNGMYNGDYAKFWSSTQSNRDFEFVECYVLYYNSPGSSTPYGYTEFKKFGLSVRCLKN